MFVYSIELLSVLVFSVPLLVFLNFSFIIFFLLKKRMCFGCLVVCFFKTTRYACWFPFKSLFCFFHWLLLLLKLYFVVIYNNRYWSILEFDILFGLVFWKNVSSIFVWHTHTQTHLSVGYFYKSQSNPCFTKTTTTSIFSVTNIFFFNYKRVIELNVCFNFNFFLLLN